MVGWVGGCVGGVVVVVLVGWGGVGWGRVGVRLGWGEVGWGGFGELLDFPKPFFAAI